jgi:hypothetical protein
MSVRGHERVEPAMTILGPAGDISRHDRHTRLYRRCGPRFPFRWFPGSEEGETTEIGPARDAYDRAEPRNGHRRVFADHLEAAEGPGTAWVDDFSL